MIKREIMEGVHMECVIRIDGILQIGRIERTLNEQDHCRDLMSC